MSENLLDMLDEQLLADPVDLDDDGPRCPGWHPGPCDWWRTCTGMTYDVAERDQAGREHPWRVTA